MGRLIVSAQMTVDCVIDPLQEWFDATLEQGDGVAQLRAADALILGRKTYQKLAEFWPKSSDAYAQLINPMPKYVASRTIDEPLTWNSHLLGPDLAKDVSALKDRHSGDVIHYGCGQLANDLARSGLVDEVRLWLHPYIWGEGVRPFQPGELPFRLRLLSATTYASGMVRLTYQPSVTT
jgi:dihydrofolate reductase